MHFAPSTYSAYGASVEPSSAGVSSLKVAGAGASTAATTLAIAAGGSAAAGPVGWAAAGVLGAAAGTVILINEIKNGKKNREAAVQWAQQIGLPDPEDSARFIVKVATKDRKWRRRELEQQQRRLRRKTGRRETKGRSRRIDRVEWKIETLRAYERYLRTGSAGGGGAAQFQRVAPGTRGTPRRGGFSSGGRSATSFTPSTPGDALPRAASSSSSGMSSGQMALLALLAVLAIGGTAYGVQASKSAKGKR